MSDLVEHLGVGKASLYATFGGKHDLYVKALERYGEVGPSPLEILSRPGSAVEAVRALVDSFAAGPQPGRPPGCMIANAAVEAYPDDVEVERQVTGSWAALEAALESTLIRARAHGELAADKDPRTLARFLLVLFQGMKVMGKSGGHDPQIRAAARQAIDVLT